MKKKKKKEEKKNYFKLFNKLKIEYGFIVTLVLSIFIIGVIFGTDNIYPFGKDIFSMVDFDSGYIPTYYKLWDIIHLQSSPFFDWNLGLGLNCFGSMIMNGFISPISWLIALAPRDSIPYSMSYIIIIKLLFMASICYYSIGKIFNKTEQKYKVLFSLLYTFSNFTILMLTHILYLDSISLFPLLVYGLLRFLKEEKWGLYFIVLNAILLMSFYQGWMCLFFIIGFGTLYLLFFDVENKQKKAIKLLLLTLLSLFSAGILFIPGFMQTMTSYRMSKNTSDAAIANYKDIYDKGIYILGLGVTFGLTIKQLFVKKDKKINIFFILLLIYLLIGVIIEPINALWHTGSHSGFPLRYGYIPTFTTCLISLYYLNNNYKEKNKNNKLHIIVTIIGLIILYFMVGKDAYLAFKGLNPSIWIDTHHEFWSAFALMVVCISITLFIIKLNKKTFNVFLYIIGLINLLLFGCILSYNIPAVSSLRTQKYMDKFTLVNDGYGYKTFSLNDNAPYIMNIPSMTNRLHFIQESELNQSLALGYFTSDTLIYSYDGTIFSDLLLMNKYTFTTNTLNSKLYTLLETQNIDGEDINLYEVNYNLNHIIPYNGKEYNELDEENIFNNLNGIYKTLFDKEDDLFEEVKLTNEGNDYSFKVSDKYIYYAYLSEIDDTQEGLDLLFNNYDLNTFTINTNKNGEQYLLQEFYEDKGIETITVTNCTLKVYRINIDNYINFVNEINTMKVDMTTDGAKRTYTFNSDKKQSILIPVNYDSSFKVLVNGKESDYSLNLYNMISVDIDEGDNTIELIYTNKWFKVGIISTVIALTILLVFSLINKRFDLLQYRLIRYPLFGLSILFVVAFFLKIYILSWI